MKKLFTLFLLLSSVLSFSQISKTGGILYSNGDPNTKGLDTLTLKNLNKNSEVAVDHSTGSMYVFDRSDSTYKAMAKVSELGNMVELTLPQFQSSVVYKTLEPGKVYKITGVHKNKTGFYIEKLYDDDNDLGITIYLTALTSNTFTNSGYGEFYNPKYQPASNYNNTDKTGMWGIWDTSVTYVTNDRVIWGGYMWYSVAGGDGTATDDFTLDSDWVKLPYSDTSAYNKVVDYIEYDFDNDFITRRRDELANIDVDFHLRSACLSDCWDINYGNPISVMQWGNYQAADDTNAEYLTGTNNNIVRDQSIYQCINFKTKDNRFNTVTYNSKIVFNTVKKYSIIQGNCFQGVFVSQNELYGGSILGNNFYNGGLTNNILISGIIEINTVIGPNGSIGYNNLSNGATISSNLINNSSITSNTLSVGGIIQNNFTNSLLNFSSSGILTSKLIRNITANNADITSNISTATTIFGDFPKNIFKRADGTIRLSYYNNSDTLQVVNVND